MGDDAPKSGPPRPGDTKPPVESPWGKAGLALLIPSVMAASPFAGYLIGWLIQRWTGWGDWLIGLFILLGLAAGARQVIQIIRRLS